MPAVLDCQRMPLGILELVKVDAWELNSEMGIEIETRSRLGDDYWDSLGKPLAIRDNPAGSSGL